MTNILARRNGMKAGLPKIRGAFDGAMNVVLKKEVGNVYNGFLSSWEII